MKVLITGAKGFIGRNLKAELLNNKYKGLIEPLYFDIDSSKEDLNKFCKECDFVVHLAGINRPQNVEEFMDGNYKFLLEVLSLLENHHNKSPILVTSSIQAKLDNPYGNSKKAGEDALFEYGIRNNVKVLVYRLPNVFGKWCRPNYNSAIATFAYNIAHDLPIQVNDRNHQMELVYIDDVIKEIISAILNQEHRNGEYCYVPMTIKTTLGEIVDTLYRCKDYRLKLNVPNNESLLEKYLYATYISYLPEDSFAYPLECHSDARGSFVEIIRTMGQGQFSLNITNPGYTKGNHFHHTKHEKYLVIQGEASIKLRKIDSDKIIEYRVSGDKLEVVDIPVGYTHNITNIGNGELLTFMWANEPFDPNNPDTIALEVEKHE